MQSAYTSVERGFAGVTTGLSGELVGSAGPQPPRGEGVCGPESESSCSPDPWGYLSAH